MGELNGAAIKRTAAKWMRPYVRRRS